MSFGCSLPTCTTIFHFREQLAVAAATDRRAAARSPRLRPVAPLRAPARNAKSRPVRRLCFWAHSNNLFDGCSIAATVEAACILAANQPNYCPILGSPPVPPGRLPQLSKQQLLLPRWLPSGGWNELVPRSHQGDVRVSMLAHMGHGPPRKSTGWSGPLLHNLDAIVATVGFDPFEQREHRLFRSFQNLCEPIVV